MRLGLLRFSLGGERHTAGEVPQGPGGGGMSVGLGRSQNRPPLLELQIHQERSRERKLRHGHLLHHPIEQRREIAGGPLRFGVTPVHGRGISEEMEIVAVVHQRVDAGRHAGDFHGVSIHLRRVGIALDRGGVVSRAGVDVSGHVNQMAGPRDQGLQPLSGGERPFGTSRSLHRVDVVMVGARVHGIPLEHRFQHGDDLFGPLRRISVVIVELPGAEIHHRLGIKRRCIEILGVTPHHLAHGPGIVLGQLGLVGLGLVGVALRQRLHEILLARGRLRRDGERLLGRTVGLPLPLRIHRQVVIGTQRVGDPPQRHGRLGIQLRGLLEGTDRLVVVEAVYQGQALVEQPLGLRTLRGDRAVVGTEARQESGILCPRGGSPVRVRRIRGQSETRREPNRQECWEGSSHELLSPGRSSAYDERSGRLVSNAVVLCPMSCRNTTRAGVRRLERNRSISSLSTIKKTLWSWPR